MGHGSAADCQDLECDADLESLGSGRDITHAHASPAHASPAHQLRERETVSEHQCPGRDTAPELVGPGLDRGLACPGSFSEGLIAEGAAPGVTGADHRVLDAREELTVGEGAGLSWGWSTSTPSCGTLRDTLKVCVVLILFFWGGGEEFHTCFHCKWKATSSLT